MAAPKKTPKRKPKTSPSTAPAGGAPHQAPRGARAPAADPPREAAPTDPAPSEAAAPRHHLPDDSAWLGAPTSDDLDLFAVEKDELELVQAGTDIGSDKVLTDLERWVGQLVDYAKILQKEKRLGEIEILMGVTRVTAAAGMTLREMAGRSSSSAARRVLEEGSVEVVAERRRKEAIAERDRLFPLVRTVSRLDPDIALALPPWLAQTATSDRLSETLAVLAQAASAILKSKSRGARVLARGGWDAARVAKLEQLAGDVKEAGERTKGGRRGGSVTQSDLDKQDGICLFHMETLLDLTEGRRKDDPRAPVLIPIATRSCFGGARKRKKVEKPGPAKPK